MGTAFGCAAVAPVFEADVAPCGAGAAALAAEERRQRPFFARLLAGAAGSAGAGLFAPAAALAAGTGGTALCAGLGFLAPTGAPVVRDFGRSPPASSLPRVWRVVLRRRPGAAGAFAAAGFAVGAALAAGFLTAGAAFAAGAFFWMPRVACPALPLAGALPFASALPFPGALPFAGAARFGAAGLLFAAGLAFAALGLRLAAALLAGAGRAAAPFFFFTMPVGPFCAAGLPRAPPAFFGAIRPRARTCSNPRELPLEPKKQVTSPRHNDREGLPGVEPAE